MLTVRWDMSRLLRLHRTLPDVLADLRASTTTQLAHVTEYAGYASALCAIKAYLPDRKVTHFNPRSAPDLWLGLSEDAGIEVAGRASGRSNYRNAVDAKRKALRARTDLKEGWLSVWGFDLSEASKWRVV